MALRDSRSSGPFPRLSHQTKGPAPSGLRQKIQKEIRELLHAIDKRIAQVLIGRCVIRPVDDQRPADNVLSWNKSPVAAVGTVIAIVAHCKIVAQWNYDVLTLRVFLVDKEAVEDIFILLVV